jgi:hypothetical protein
MVGMLVVLIGGFTALFAFLFCVSRDMRRGLRAMKHLTREVEALLDDRASRPV